MRIMGIINLSPESFFKESVKEEYKQITETAMKMEEDGAEIIDLGAMSTAPYLNTMISIEEEVARLKIGIKAVKDACNITISVDTPRSEVAREALRLGADMINDVTGLKYDDSMASIIKEYDSYVLLSAYSKSRVRGGIKDTIKALDDSIKLALDEGIGDDKIIIDPAIGFFRKKRNNPFFTRISNDWFTRDLLIIKRLEELKRLKKPICVSVSRKSFIGKIVYIEEPSERLFGSISAEAIAVMNGADIIRTHNVHQSMQAVKIAEAIRRI